MSYKKYFTDNMTVFLFFVVKSCIIIYLFACLSVCFLSTFVFLYLSASVSLYVISILVWWWGYGVVVITPWKHGVVTGVVLLHNNKAWTGFTLKGRNLWFTTRFGILTTGFSVIMSFFMISKKIKINGNINGWCDV